MSTPEYAGGERGILPRNANMVIPSLTARQREVYVFVVRYFKEHHGMPSYREIAEAIHVPSPNAITGHLAALQRKGLLLLGRTARQARGIKLAGIDIELSFQDTAAGHLARLLLFEGNDES